MTTTPRGAARFPGTGGVTPRRRLLVSTWVALTLSGALLALALALVARRRRRLGPAVPDPIVATRPAPATSRPKVPVG